MRSYKLKIPEYIMLSAQLAASLEVSGWPKPGNVHRTVDFKETRFEHFLAGAIAMGPSIREVATRGVKAGREEIDVSELKLGELIRKAVYDINQWHKGGNTHLGICLLFIPLAAAAGKVMKDSKKLELSDLRKNVDIVMRSSTAQDAANVYEAILMVSSKKELGEYKPQKAPDLYDPESRRELIEKNISFFDTMKIASKWDTVAKELVTAMEISFELGQPTLERVFKETKDINIATVHTFLTILSKIPDSFIARKIGLKETSDIIKAVEIGRRKIKWISEDAALILEKGGLNSKEGSEALWNLDRSLHKNDSVLNPGTTADLASASLMIAILNGLRY